MEIAQMVFAAHSIEVVCILDVLADEGERHYQSFRDIPNEIASRFGCLLSQKPGVPTKYLKFYHQLWLIKRSWRQHL